MAQNYQPLFSLNMTNFTHRHELRQPRPFPSAAAKTRRWNDN